MYLAIVSGLVGYRYGASVEVVRCSYPFAAVFNNVVQTCSQVM
jgi:hypothetical protein